MGESAALEFVLEETIFFKYSVKNSPTANELFCPPKPPESPKSFQKRSSGIIHSSSKTSDTPKRGVRTVFDFTSAKKPPSRVRMPSSTTHWRSGIPTSINQFVAIKFSSISKKEYVPPNEVSVTS